MDEDIEGLRRASEAGTMAGRITFVCLSFVFISVVILILRRRALGTLFARMRGQAGDDVPVRELTEVKLALGTLGACFLAEAVAFYWVYTVVHEP